MENLVVFFSHKGETYFGGEYKYVTKGNANYIAEFARDALKCDIFEVQRVKPYPANYQECCDEALVEQRKQEFPELAQDIDIKQYKNIVLVYPCWWGTLPRPVFTFLKNHDFSGKNIYPICTHEGSGMGGSEVSIKNTCDADVKRGLAIRGTQAQSSKSVVEKYVQQIK